MATTRIDEATLRSLATQSLSKWITTPAHATGRELVRQADADRAVSWLVSAERHGLHSFGAELLVRELRRLSDHPLSSPEPHRAAGAVVAIDAVDLPGQLALASAVRLLLDGVATSGIFAVSLAHVGALGVLGLAAREVAAQGYLAVFCANAPAMVAPWGGSRPAVGTNPLAVAAPRAGQAPLVIDYATSPITMAALKTAALTGEQIAAPGGFTEQGEATTDAASVRTIASDSRIASLTGLSIEILTRAAAGVKLPVAEDATALRATGGPAGVRTGVLLALDPRFFGTDAYDEDIALLAAQWAGSGGHVPARFDGLEAAAETSHDLEVHSDTLAALQRIAAHGSAAAAN